MSDIDSVRLNFKMAHALYPLEWFSPLPCVGTRNRYSVGSLGTIRSDNGIRCRFLRPRMMSRGYLVVWLHSKDHPKGKNYYVHRLVAEAFCERKESETEIHHIDGYKENNRWSNLLWIAPSRHQSFRKAKDNGKEEEQAF